jgi:hypothetical protein
MRNLTQYPITDEEIIRILEKYYSQSLTSGLIGGIDGVCLKMAIERVRENPKPPEGW